MFQNGLESLRTAEEFTHNFERSRNIHIRPLTHAYHKLVASEHLIDTDLLCLGIGTGKVEEMMGLDSARITAVDFNQSLLDKAKTRLPRARFIQGRMGDVISSVDYTSTVLTQEALDCIPPKNLPELVAQNKKKTDKLVAVQTYSPDPEFYGSSWQGAG
ncbi:class I SAM-dependent methyltransferase, partial [Candidatus Curtissbacteria bacterium]|nr:class I SAM-dependent methyltransferase [Candidatus Curtissbacteria bacterium]